MPVSDSKMTSTESIATSSFIGRVGGGGGRSGGSLKPEKIRDSNKLSPNTKHKGHGERKQIRKIDRLKPRLLQKFWYTTTTTADSYDICILSSTSEEGARDETVSFGKSSNTKHCAVRGAEAEIMHILRTLCISLSPLLLKHYIKPCLISRGLLITIYDAKGCKAWQ